MSEYLMEMVGYSVEGTAEWRRAKAEEFPEDTRNREAAEQLERLAAEIRELDGSGIETQISELHYHQISDGFDWQCFSEDVSAELRSIGFHNSCGNATGFLEWYRDLLKEQLLETVKDKKSLESRVRQKAKRRGHTIYKSRDRSLHSNNHGGYMLADWGSRGVVLGTKYDASLDEIEEYLSDVPLYGRAA